MSPSITSVSAAVAILVGLTSLYLFFLNKPSMRLRLETEVPPHPVEDGILLMPSFVIENKGRKFAEDVYVNLELKGWGFGDNTYKVAGKATSSTDRRVGKKNDESWVTEGAAVRLDAPQTVLDVDSHSTTSLGAPGESRELFLNNIVYEDTEFEFRYGSALLDPNNTYRIDYTIACRSHGPRTGRIEIATPDIEETASEFDVSIVAEHPTRLQRIQSLLRYI